MRVFNMSDCVRIDVYAGDVMHARVSAPAQIRVRACRCAQCQINNVADAENSTGPALIEAPRVDNLTTSAYCRSYTLHKGRTNDSAFIGAAVRSRGAL